MFDYITTYVCIFCLPFLHFHFILHFFLAAHIGPTYVLMPSPISHYCQPLRRHSARVRQNYTTSTPASPLLTLQVEDNASYYLAWNGSVGQAWQWAAMDITLDASGMDRNATVIMNVTLIGSSAPNSFFYFDDISVGPLTTASKSQQ